MSTDNREADAGTDGEPDAGEKGGQDGAKSQDYKAHDKSDSNDEQDNLEDRPD